jgi:hypothetical protein
MRRASYQIPPVKGDPKPGELNVFILGGDVDANIQRWVDEFSGFDPKSVVRNDRNVNDMRQAVVEVPKGKFNGGMNEVKVSDNWGLLGAIVVAPSGAEYFFKLTGPSATVKAAKGTFYRMLDSVRQEGEHAQAGSAEPPKAATAAKEPSAAAKPVASAPAKK